jgi:AmmeMemoRadiSam system protein B
MGVTPLRASIRPPIVDGLFYPSREESLAATLDGLLARSTTPEGAAAAVISPHAGYEYAGVVMAAAYRAVAKRPVRRAVIIGPAHRDPGASIFLPESEAFATPLGPVAVDMGALATLAASSPVFQCSDVPHLEEHCLEVQLPFLVRLFPGLVIVPLLVGCGVGAAVEAITGAFREFFDAEDTLFVVSSNMASYMTGKDTEAERAAMEQLIAAGDWRGIAQALQSKRISACGAAGIAALLALAGSSCRARFLARASSRGMDEDPSRIVHYAAVDFDTGVRAWE